MEILKEIEIKVDKNRQIDCLNNDLLMRSSIQVYCISPDYTFNTIYAYRLVESNI